MDSSGGDPYRSHLSGEGEENTVWRHGAPPTYDAVNALFEAERTQEWPAGSLEEVVQNAIKTWEMELSHKPRLSDFKSVSPGRFTLSVNGGRARTGEATLAVGSYNALLDSPLLASSGAYDAAAETFRSSHDLFRAAFPRGFAWEVLKVYSAPPVIAFKFRHWGHKEGPYKGRAATGGRAAAGGGRGGLLRPGGAFGWAPQGPQGGFVRGGTRRGGARREAQRGRYRVGVRC
ncbi:unnamed protein product [Urochloa decumbens]|uniref:Pathogen-related protein n=1 Tax=Urochloa decumbens TaxID=240449 RepID=A0ABC8YRB9_9POAL